jgi:acid stress-induced BolA-like protein IbaG/YrbA
MTSAEGNQSEFESTVKQAVEVVSDTLATADSDQRDQLVDTLNDQLREAGVHVVDMGLPTNDEDERKGVKTGRTRQEVLADIALRGLKKDMHRVQLGYPLGRRKV